jgi:hypothetical protein
MSDKSNIGSTEPGQARKIVPKLKLVQNYESKSTKLPEPNSTYGTLSSRQDNKEPKVLTKDEIIKSARLEEEGFEFPIVHPDAANSLDNINGKNPLPKGGKGKRRATRKQSRNQRRSKKVGKKHRMRRSRKHARRRGTRAV